MKATVAVVVEPATALARVTLRSLNEALIASRLPDVVVSAVYKVDRNAEKPAMLVSVGCGRVGVWMLVTLNSTRVPAEVRF